MNASQLKQRYGHACTLEKQDLFDEIVKLQKASSKLFFKSTYVCFSISENNKRFSHYCRSQYRLRLEKIYHVTKHPFKIHPISVFRIVWEVFMILISVATLIMVPMNQTFSLLPALVIEPYGWHYYLKLLLNIICMIDILINFQTGYYDEKCNIVFECKKIALHYLKRRFICDLLSSIPNIQPTEYRSRNQNYIQYIFTHCIVLLKTLRIVSLITYSRNVGECFGLHNITIELLQLFEIVIVILHWTACIIIFFGTLGIGLFEYDEPMEESWLGLNDVYNSSVTLVYVTSLYRAACFLSGADYAIGLDYNRWDMFLKTFCWILSKALFGVCIGFTIQIARSSNSPTILFRRKLQKMLQYADQKQINLRTTKRIISFYEFKFRNKFFKEKDILRNISPKLRSDLLMFNRLKLLKRIDFFKGLPETLLTYIGACLRQQFYLTGDVIVNANQKGDGLYLILTGTVVFYTASGIEYTHMYDGQYFGEVELIIPGLKTICTVIALEASELYFLSHKDFHEAIGFVKQFPEIIQRIHQHIDKRILRVKTIEERFIQMQNERMHGTDEENAIFFNTQYDKNDEIRKRVAQLKKEAEEEKTTKGKIVEKSQRKVKTNFVTPSLSSIPSTISLGKKSNGKSSFEDSENLTNGQSLEKDLKLDSQDFFTAETQNVKQKMKIETVEELTKKSLEVENSAKISEPETNVQILKEAVEDSAQQNNDAEISRIEKRESAEILQEVKTDKSDNQNPLESAEISQEPKPTITFDQLTVYSESVEASPNTASSTSVRILDEGKKDHKKKKKNPDSKKK